MPTIRPARKSDAADIARLANIAGSGLPLYFWTALTPPEADPWMTGVARVRDEQTAVSYTNTVIADIDGDVAGIMIGYDIPLDPEPVPDDANPVIRPIWELENLATETRYIYVLAVDERYRRRGIAESLMAKAEKQAGKNGMSLVVSDGNPAARKLYEKCGYRVSASAPVIKGGWHHDGENWLLMCKPPQ